MRTTHILIFESNRKKKSHKREGEKNVFLWICDIFRELVQLACLVSVFPYYMADHHSTLSLLN